MILKRLTKGNRATLYAWADYTADAIRRREEKRRRDERKVKMAVRKLMYRNKGKAFSTWAKFAVQMRNLKKQMKRAFLGRKAYSFEKWDMYRWNCKATRAVRLLLCVCNCVTLHSIAPLAFVHTASHSSCVSIRS